MYKLIPLALLLLAIYYLNTKISALQLQVKLCDQSLAQAQHTATQNATTMLKTNLKAKQELEACFSDYKTLADKFDAYRNTASLVALPARGVEHKCYIKDTNESAIVRHLDSLGF